MSPSKQKAAFAAHLPRVKAPIHTARWNWSLIPDINIQMMWRRSAFQASPIPPEFKQVLLLEKPLYPLVTSNRDPPLKLEAFILARPIKPRLYGSCSFPLPDTNGN